MISTKIILQDTLRNLAEIALGMWPAWYGQPTIYLQPAHLELLPSEQIYAFHPNISPPWFQRASQLCQKSKLPLIKKLPRNLQLSQLALTIDPNNLTFILAICDPTPLPERLFSVSRLSTWLAQETGARVAVLIPPDLTHHAGLAPILYEAATLATQSQSAPESQPEEKERHTIWPIEGRPHPSSPGEQRLAAALAQDTELAALFQFNQPIITNAGTTYFVDLLWSVGQVVIEVDGYSYHSGPIPFRVDRQRDYELLISGYIVLRLPHDEVMNDVKAALKKIRAVVRFRRSEII